MVPVIDSHCHLDFDDFAKDLPAVLERARQAGLVAMICVGSGADLATAQRAADLAAREPDVFAAIGVHPHDAAKIEDDWWPVLNKLAQSPRV
jgi:TatD DNase family protein